MISCRSVLLLPIFLLWLVGCTSALLPASDLPTPTSVPSAIPVQATSTAFATQTSLPPTMLPADQQAINLQLIRAAEAGSRNLIVTYPDEPLKYAVAEMLKNEIGRLPVVSRDDPRQLLGYLGRTGLLEARLRKMQEEEHRERRWNVVSIAE